jgi:hypothetical protein
MDLLVVDPVVAELLARHRNAMIHLLPTWIDAEPVECDRGIEPKTVLIVAGGESVPEAVLWETLAAIDRVRAEHPGIRFVLCGSAASGQTKRTDLPVIPEIDHEEFRTAVHERPICVVLGPTGGPPRPQDLAAGGCLTIVVKTSGESIGTVAEVTTGVIEVRAERLEIARAVDSLLIDSVRRGSLMMHAAEYARSLPGPGEAARALIEEFRLFRETGQAPHRRDATTSLNPSQRLAMTSGRRVG